MMDKDRMSQVMQTMSKQNEHLKLNDYTKRNKFELMISQVEDPD